MGHFVGLYDALRHSLLQCNLPSTTNLYVTKLARSNYKNATLLQRLEGTKEKVFFWHISLQSKKKKNRGKNLKNLLNKFAQLMMRVSLGISKGVGNVCLR